MDNPRIQRVVMTEEQIRAMARGSRDFILKVTEEGDVSARCKAYATSLQIRQSGELLWFQFPNCNRLCFYPLTNVQRDLHFASEDKAAFISELFYLRQLPPNLKSPFNSRPIGNA